MLHVHALLLALAIPTIATLQEALQLSGATIVGLLTVPVMDLIKKLLSFVAKWPAWAQRITAIVLAYVLSVIGTIIQTPLPTDLHLFTNSSVTALLSGAVALAAHAGNKAKTT